MIWEAQFMHFWHICDNFCLTDSNGYSIYGRVGFHDPSECGMFTAGVGLRGWKRCILLHRHGQCPVVHYVRGRLWRLAGSRLSYQLSCVRIALIINSLLYPSITSITSKCNHLFCWSPRLASSLLFFVVDSVCPFVMLLQIASSFLFVDGIKPYFGCQFSMWHSTKLFS